MSPTPLIQRCHQDRHWAKQQILAVAEQLTEHQLQRSFEIGQGSIWKSLTHLYAAEYVWLEALNGNETPLTPGDAAGQLPGNQQGEGAMVSLSELTIRWAKLDEQWNTYLDTLTQNSLSKFVYKVSSTSGQRQRTQVSDILIHICTHAQYTIAQIVNMMRHAGAGSLKDTMLITLARQEQP